MKHGRTLIALAGCPNTGKTTIFNGLTGQNTPTGNWAGTTAGPAMGSFYYSGSTYLMTDLPGPESLTAGRDWETLVRDFINSGIPDAVLVVIRAAELERGLAYLSRLLHLDHVRDTGLPVVLCLNLWDETEKMELSIDVDLLSDVLQIPVVPCCARCREYLDDVKSACHHACHPDHRGDFHYECLDFSPKSLARECAPRLLAKRMRGGLSTHSTCPARSLDHLMARPILGKLFLFLALTGILWLSMGSTLLFSRLLANAMTCIEGPLSSFLALVGTPLWFRDWLVLGLYRPLSWAVPLMLPPLAVFFPILSLLKEAGLLPRAAFAMDRCLERCRACGKQCMSMAVGLGCNASGVISCRCIASPRERLLAVLTNSLIPCSGKFPVLAALVPLFFYAVLREISPSHRSAELAGHLPVCLMWTLIWALIMAAAFAAAAGASLACSCLLSHTILKGSCSSFTLELPPFRRPQAGKVICRSLFERSILVLGRAAALSIPAALAIWICAQIFIAGPGNRIWFTFTPGPNRVSLLQAVTGFLNPLGALMGMDGVILTAFLLGTAANETVLPLLFMLYLQTAPLIQTEALPTVWQFLAERGWTWQTALCTIIFCLFHWPCATTRYTIRRETGSPRWTAVAVMLPTALGMALCIGMHGIMMLF